MGLCQSVKLTTLRPERYSVISQLEFAMQVKSLYIQREAWGVNKGQLTGKIEFTNESGEVHVNLDPEMSQRMIVICAEAIAEHSRKIGALMTAEVIDAARPLIEG